MESEGYEILYGISIDGHKPTVWSEDYPTQKEIEFNITPQCKSVEIIEKDVNYFKVAKIK